MKSHVLGRRHLRHCRQCLVPRPHHTQHCCAYCDLPNFETGAHHRDLVEPGGSVCECLGHALGNVGVDDVRRTALVGGEVDLEVEDDVDAALGIVGWIARDVLLPLAPVPRAVSLGFRMKGLWMIDWAGDSMVLKPGLLALLKKLIMSAQ